MTTIVNFLEARLTEIEARDGNTISDTEDPKGKPCPSCGHVIDGTGMRVGFMDPSAVYEFHHYRQSRRFDDSWDMSDRTETQTCAVTPDQWKSLAKPQITEHARYVRADVAAKRRLIDQVFQYESTIDGEWGCCHDADQIRAGLCRDTKVNEIEALRIMALPFASHPDYEPAYAPEDADAAE